MVIINLDEKFDGWDAGSVSNEPYILPSDDELDIIKELYSPIFEYRFTRFEKIETECCVQKMHQEWYNLNEDKNKPNIFQFFKYHDGSWIVSYVPKSEKKPDGSWYCKDNDAMFLLSDVFKKHGMKNCDKITNSVLLEYIREYKLSNILNDL